MKKNYVTPVMVGEEFVADEFIAMCYEIACATGAKDTTGRGVKDECCGHSHTKKSNGSGCGHAENQNVQIISGSIEEGNAIYRIIEINNDSYDPLDCILFDSKEDMEANRNGKRTGVLNTNAPIYWATNVGVMGYTVWMHHTGQFELVSADHPNRS